MKCLGLSTLQLNPKDKIASCGVIIHFVEGHCFICIGINVF